MSHPRLTIPLSLERGHVMIRDTFPHAQHRLVTVAQAGRAIAGHGFADEFGTVDAPGGWNALVYLSNTLLLNVGEVEMAEQWRTAWGDARITAWVQTNELGQHRVVMHARTNSQLERDLLTAWDEISAEATHPIPEAPRNCPFCGYPPEENHGPEGCPAS